MSRAARRWPPRLPCFVPRLCEYLARIEQRPLSALLGRPDALGRALRRASTLLELEAECLEVPVAWLGVEEDRPRLALCAALGTLRNLDQSTAPATLIAVPSPETLARASGGNEHDARSVLQALLRSLGELDVLAGVMLDGDDGVAALGGILDHYGMTAICIRGASDESAGLPGVLVARAYALAALTKRVPAASGTTALITT